ncbi:hypothetical protein Sipo7851_04510 [Streptomyces ipomoeae]|nr:hypothetical protein Sipo7851_04510 [Streptomyces ipomoeae]
MGSGSGSPTRPSSSGRLSPVDLQSRWWTWAASEPEETNAVADPDGGDCTRNQAGDVWFLAGTFGTQVERSCVVPVGLPLAFPLVNFVGDPADCAAFLASADGTATLDGVNLPSDRYDGQVISVQAVDGNPVTGDGADFAATGCGLWVQVPAPEPGEHTLKIRGTSGDFAVAVDYSLTVRGKG